jgi:hypothetical protein
MTALQKVEAEIARYDHALLRLEARQKADGSVELVIRTKQEIPDVHTYHAPIHPATSTIRSFPGRSRGTCTTACTTT